MTIRDEGARLAAELARMVDVESGAVEHAIEAQDQRYVPNRRNRVSTLSTVAWLTALLSSMPATERRSWLSDSADAQPSRLERLLAGDLASAAADLADHTAGPFDVSWDGNWPNAAPRLRGLIPSTARLGDRVIGGDHGGTRIEIQVIQDNDGVITGEELRDTWVDPPLEDVWLDIYRRLAALYPDEIPED